MIIITLEVLFNTDRLGRQTGSFTSGSDYSHLKNLMFI